MVISVFVATMEIGPPYSSYLAGMRRYAYSLVRSLVTNPNIDVFVASNSVIPPEDPILDYPNIHFYHIKPKKKFLDGHYRNWRSIKRNGKYFSKKALAAFHQLDQTYNFSLVHTIDFASFSFLKAKIKDNFSLPVVISLSNPIIIRMINKRLIRCADQLILTNVKSQEKIVQLCPTLKKKTTIIPLSINCKKFSSIPPIEKMESFRRKYDIEQGKKILLIMGPFIPRKKQNEIIDYFPSIIKVVPEIQFLLCGDGPTLKCIKDKILIKKLEDYVSITGYIPEEELPVTYHVSSLLLYTAESGSFGTPIIEAMSAGLPIIAADKPPMNEILNFESLYNPNDKESVIDKIKTILLNDSIIEQISFDQQKKALSHYDYAVVGRKLVKTYEKVLS